MIALLIGGTVVLCMGLLAVVYGVPIKEFSFGNTMILAGSVVSCTGLLLIGLYFVGRELKNLTRRLETGLPALTPQPISAEISPPRTTSAPQDLPPIRPPLRAAPVREDTLFTRDHPFDSVQEPDQFSRDYTRHDSTLPEENGPSSVSRQERSSGRLRSPATAAETAAPEPIKPVERPRRNIMFSSHRRDSKNQELSTNETSPPDFGGGDEQPLAEDVRERDAGTDADNAFATAWPQSGRPRPELPSSQSVRAAPPPVERDSPEPPRERFQPPRRADVSPVTIVKSGVVDSMAYSLYSDGSIEAQMPEGMVRFASIDELRSHLDQRG